ncbi:MAG: response regulator transcription factor [Cyclobacteriaceae bacterium]
MPKEKINILVVDDHTLFRKGSVMLVKSFDIAENVFEAENGKVAIETVNSQPIDLILLDLDMPIMGGKDTAKQLLKTNPEIHIIMVSMNQELAMISELIEIGVHSYMLKDSEPEELNRAVRCVLNNEFYYNQIVSKALHQKFKERPTGSMVENNLTRREVEILGLICQELTMKQIGDKLFLSEQTVHTHRKNLMKKVNVSNAVGLVKYAIKERIISL